jgi:hypothetical protein
MNDRDELLRPSLGSETSPETSIYSATTGFLAAFFGGPLGGAIIAMVNAWRLKRLASDWPLAVAAIALTVGLLWWELRAGGAEWLVDIAGKNGVQIALRVAGLAFFSVVYAIHRTYYRSMELFAVEPPSGWALGFGATVAGFVTTLFIASAM